MENRKQFTMYESIYKSLQRIRNKKDRADAYDAICAYALYNIEPNLETAPDAVAIAFELMRPVLDSARKKAESGKQGGSKSKAKGKQTQREKENEEEKEVEGEKENEEEIEKESLSLSAADESARERASEEELLSIGIKPGEFCGITKDFVQEVRRATYTLFSKYQPQIYPQPWDFRQVSQYCGSVGRAQLLEYAFEKAAVAGKLGDWRYIDGIMDRLHMRGIETEEQARMWDNERPDRENEE